MKPLTEREMTTVEGGLEELGGALSASIGEAIAYTFRPGFVFRVWICFATFGIFCPT